MDSQALAIMAMILSGIAVACSGYALWFGP